MAFTEQELTSPSQRIVFFSDFLRRAGTLLSNSLDYQRTLPELGALVVPLFADWCVVDLIDSSGAFDRVVLSQGDPGKQALQDELLRDYAPDRVRRHPIMEVLTTGKPELVSEVTKEWIATRARDERHRELIWAVGLHSAMYLPLHVDGELIGVLGMHGTDPARPRFDRHDLQVGELLAALVASAVRNARYTTELQGELHRRRIAEERLHEVVKQQGARMQELRTVMNTVPAGVWLAEDPDCQVMWGNAEAHRQVGAGETEEASTPARDPALGQMLDVRMRGTGIHGIEVPMCRAARDGIATRNEEVECVLADGTRTWLSFSATPVLDENGNPRGAVGASLDITHLKAFEADLLQHKEELEDEVHERTRALVETHQRLREMERMATIGTLSAGLGHDMGNLLLPLRLRLDSLNSMNLPEPAQSDLEAIGKVVEYLQRLTTGLRSLAVDPKADRAKNAETRLKTWWADVQNLMKNALPPSVILDAVIPSRLPLVRVSSAALTQAILNVVQNAGHALQGRRDGRISLRVRHLADSDRICITVSDNGPGLDDEAKLHCFEPFYSTKKRQISTGLGLAVVRALIMGAGGEVSVDSAKGEGATFTFLLPVDRRKPQQNRAADPARQALLSVSDPRQRALLASVLRHDGFDVKYGEPRIDAEYLLFITDGMSDGAHGQLLAFVEGDGRRIGLLVNAPEAPLPHPQIHALRSASDVTGLRAMLNQVAGGGNGDRQNVV